MLLAEEKHFASLDLSRSSVCLAEKPVSFAIPNKKEWEALKKDFGIPSNLDPDVSVGAALEKYYKEIAAGSAKSKALTSLASVLKHYKKTIDSKVNSLEFVYHKTYLL